MNKKCVKSLQTNVKYFSTEDTNKPISYLCLSIHIHYLVIF